MLNESVSPKKKAGTTIESGLKTPVFLEQRRRLSSTYLAQLATIMTALEQASMLASMALT